MEQFLVIVNKDALLVANAAQTYLTWKQNKSVLNPIGLILCGGESERMGKPKGLLEYEGKPQFEHLSDLLSELGIETYISCRKEQLNLFGSNRNFIHDRESGTQQGPMAGLLAAALQFPDTGIFVLGCDYPLVQKHHIIMLLDAYLGTGKTSCLYDFSEQTPQPLLCIYSPQTIQAINESETKGNFSLLNILKDTDYNGIVPEHPLVLMSFDTPRDASDFIALKASLSVKRLHV